MPVSPTSSTPARTPARPTPAKAPAPKPEDVHDSRPTPKSKPAQDTPAQTGAQQARSGARANSVAARVKLAVTAGATVVAGGAPAAAKDDHDHDHAHPPRTGNQPGTTQVPTQQRSAERATPVGAPTPVAKPEPVAPEQMLEDAKALVETSPTGAAVLDDLERRGVEIQISEDADYAHFDNSIGEAGAVVLNPVVFSSTEQVAGVLVHEAGHAILDGRGDAEDLRELPDGVGMLANEVISESLASAVAKEAGFERGSSSMTRPDGTIRSPAEGFDDIMGSEFYVDYYSIDLATFTPEERQVVYDEVTTQSIELIQSLGGTPPDEYLAGAEPFLRSRKVGWFPAGVETRWRYTGVEEAPRATTPVVNRS